MKTNSNAATVPRRWLWPAIGVLALLAWTAYSQITWAQRAGHLHGLPAFFLGVVVLLAVNALVRFCAGAWRGGWCWLVSRNAWRLCGWTVLFIVSLVALFYAAELWRGKRAWAAVAREAKARGETLDYETLLTPQPPDDQNFAKAPLFAPFFGLDDAQTRKATAGQIAELVGPFHARRHKAGTPFAPWLEGRESDLLLCWEFHFQTNRQDVPDKAKVVATMLAALEPYSAIIEQVRPFSSRPACWFPLEQRVPDLMDSQASWAMNKLLRLVRLRASTDLATKRPDAAFENLRLILRLADYGRQRPQPTSIAYTEHHFAVVDGLQPLWEGLTQHAWTAAQIAELQRQLEQLDLLNDYDDAVRADALTMATFVERLIPTANPRPSRELFEGADEQRALDLVRWVYPVGWSLQDQAAIHRLHLERTSMAIELAKRRIGDKSNDRPRELFGYSDPFFPVFITPKLWEMYAEARESFPFTQTVVDLATLACALERYRLAGGEYPATLDALVPQFVAKLPHDVINGEPLKYRRTDGGGFVLYSVGFNQVDDGGKPSPRHRDWRGLLFPKPDLDTNDWVWICPGDKVTN